MPKRNIIWGLIVIAMAVVLFLVWKHPNGGGSGARDDFQAVQRAYEVIHTDFFRPVDAEKLQQSTIRHMVRQLDDPFSKYLTAEEADLLSRRLHGSRMGLGVVVGVCDEGAEVLGLRVGSPAYSSGLRKGDIILAIDGRETRGLAVAELNETLNAPPAGREVELTYQRPTSDTPPQTLEMEVVAYPLETVEGLYRDAEGRWAWWIPETDGLAYVRLTEFCPQTVSDLRLQLRRLGSLRGLVLDLRGNPGGLLPDGVAAADLFLRSGEIVIFLDRQGRRQIQAAHNDTAFDRLPMVMLVDDATASAAELLAGALAANARAVILGTRTCGKGCVQSLYQLPDDMGALNITTREFLVPPGRIITHRGDSETWGIQPHIVVPYPSPQARADLHQLYDRAALWFGPSEGEIDRQTSPTADRGLEILRQDPQLSRAVELLSEPTRYRQEIRHIEARIEAETFQDNDRP